MPWWHHRSGSRLVQVMWLGRLFCKNNTEAKIQMPRSHARSVGKCSKRRGTVRAKVLWWTQVWLWRNLEKASGAELMCLRRKAWREPGQRRERVLLMKGGTAGKTKELKQFAA